MNAACECGENGIKKPLTVLQKAIYAGDKEFIDWLLDAGADINRRNPQNKTPLDGAIEIENNDMIEHLLSRGAKL